MSERDLRRMLEQASEFCERQFAKKHEIAPMWHAVTSAGEMIFEPHPTSLSKDMGAAVIRAFFDFKDVVRYVYVGEAWTLKRMIRPEEKEAIFHKGIADHPERVEVVQIMGEDQECGHIILTRNIIRPPRGAPYLGPLQSLDDLPFIPPNAHSQAEGRMIGMLPARGTRQ